MVDTGCGHKWNAKLQDIYLDELTQGFANETRPNEVKLSDSVYKLTGSLEEQYSEWRDILAQMYKLETN